MSFMIKHFHGKIIVHYMKCRGIKENYIALMMGETLEKPTVEVS